MSCTISSCKSVLTADYKFDSCFGFCSVFKNDDYSAEFKRTGVMQKTVTLTLSYRFGMSLVKAPVIVTITNSVVGDPDLKIKGSKANAIEILEGLSSVKNAPSWVDEFLEILKKSKKSWF